MTNEELTNAINDAISDFSDSVSGFLEEAARRLQEGRADDALRQSFRYGARIVEGERMLDEEQPIPPLEGIPGLPTQPGWHWWKRDAQSREIMVQVLLKNGELTVWWPNQDTSVAKLKGYSRGPLRPSHWIRQPDSFLTSKSNHLPHSALLRRCSCFSYNTLPYKAVIPLA